MEGGVQQESSPIERPCPNCGGMMRLFTIEPTQPGYDKRSFKCTACAHEDSIIVKVENGGDGA
jgi:ssDNA-binding Zn-finger/Zn-ribbon topoisomerase 1